MAFGRVALAFSACLVGTVDADAFLGHHNDRILLVQEVETFLFRELASETSMVEIERVAEILQPLFATLPKTEGGKLETTVVRYALHRYFAQQYGWHLNGLAQAGKSWNSTSPSVVMDGQVPTYIEGLIEERLGHGLGLHDLAVLAFAMSELIHKEIVQDVEHVFEVQSTATTSRMKLEEFQAIIKMTLVARIDGVDEGGKTPEEYVKSEQHLAENYHLWEDVKLWASDLHSSFRMFRKNRNPFVTHYDFDYAVSFMQELALGYGHFQHMECRSQKNQLMELEHAGTGRVPLTQFYKGIRHESWPFVEKEAYLRALGALDESNPAQPSVIIPNYINGLSNCIKPSAFYSVCCVNECEGLMAQVELAIASPEGDPTRIFEVVSNIGSDTVDAPRNLSTTQKARLVDIAQLHGGSVPLHGRLFAQWMHHAFPRECEFPHVSGTTNPEIIENWEARTGSDTSVDEDEIRHYLFEGRSREMAFKESSVALPWIAVEELVAANRINPHEGGRQLSKPLRAIMLFLAVGSALFQMTRGSADASPRKLESHLV